MRLFQSIPESDGDRRINQEDGGGDNESEQEEDERSSDEGFMGMTPLLQAHHAMEKMEEFVHKVMNMHPLHKYDSKSTGQCLPSTCAPPVTFLTTPDSSDCVQEVSK